jgi:hypothetical protein
MHMHTCTIVRARAVFKHELERRNFRWKTTTTIVMRSKFTYPVGVCYRTPVLYQR